MNFEILAFLISSAFIVSVLGVIFGIGDYKLNTKRALIGIFGNLLIALFIVSMTVYTVYISLREFQDAMN